MPGGCPDSSSPRSGDDASSPVAVVRNAGFPQYDPMREVSLFGKLLPNEASTLPAALTIGDWDVEAGRLLPSSGLPRSEQFWFPDLDGATIANGMIRARLEVVGHTDVAVLVRHEVERKTPTLSGYEVSITDGVLSIDRRDAGVSLPMTPAIKLPTLPALRSIEIIISVIGAQVSASAYDGDSLTLLGSAAATDESYTSGRVGIRVGPRHDRTAGLTFLATTDATKPEVGMSAPFDKQEFDGYRVPIGAHRYVFLAASDAVALPSWARKRVKAWIDDEQGQEQAILLVDPTEHERLLRSGVPLQHVEGDVPWKALHPEFRARVDEKPVRRGRGFVLDDSYKDPEMVADLLRAYNALYPEISRLVEIGKTHQGRSLWALKISDRAAISEGEPSILMDGTHHASELLSTEYVLDIVDTLLTGYEHDERVRRWVDEMEIWCLPVVNPDGLHRFVHESLHAARKNARDNDFDGIVTPFEGVDLNRNYPFAWGGQGIDYLPTHRWYRGPSAASEPETQAMMRLARDERFAGVLSFHTHGTDIYPPYLVDGKREVAPDVFRTMAEEVAGAVPAQSDGRFYAVRSPPHPVDGCAHDWHTHEYGAAAFVVEGSHHNPEPAARRRSIEGVRPFWMGMLDRIYFGPGISGQVSSLAGDPLVAEVMIEELTTFEGESWTTRSRDGRFDRAVASQGVYTLRIAAAGYLPVEHRVEVKHHRRRVDVAIVLTPVGNASGSK
jgi:hypothetical protein